MRRQRPTAKSQWNRPGVGSVPPAMSTLDFLQTTNGESVASTGRCPHMYPNMYPICHCEERSDVAISMRFNARRANRRRYDDELAKSLCSFAMTD